MAKPTATFTCTACGAVHRKWAGRCEACGAWNSIVEEAPLAAGPKGPTLKGRTIPLSDLATAEPPPPRIASGVEELDRVLGGGLVPASAVLVGGDPGIGKSTLLLQATAAYARQGLSCLYVSGEEASAQVRMRAAAHELVTFAKRRGVAVILVGHVTKDGQIAGPRVVEHMVDCVLYFEGERGHQFRILRAVKNRFGPSGEIGVFEMTGAGLTEVTNPSALFLSERGAPSAGSAVFAGIEGTRPVLTEIQALVAPSPLGTPRRTVVGLDGGRLSTILAVLEARCGIPFAGLDVFLNVAGGLRVTEPAADLAVAAALLSAREDVAIPPDTVLFGEISLSGALRPVGQTENRLKEASKLGFSRAIAPSRSKTGEHPGITVSEMPDLTAMVGQMFGAG